MKVAFLLSILVVAVLVQDSEAFIFRRIRDRVRQVGSKVGEVAKQAGEGIKDVTGKVRDAVRRGGQTIRQGIHRAADRARDAARRVRDRLGKLFRGKREALTMNPSDNANAFDIGLTLNLDLPVIKAAFAESDVNKDMKLDGQEVITFIAVIDELSSSPNVQNAATKH